MRRKRGVEIMVTVREGGRWLPWWEVGPPYAAIRFWWADGEVNVWDCRLGRWR